VQSYYAASMDLLSDEPSLNLFDPEWHILTREHNRPPTCIETGASVRRSVITDGCQIAGQVEGSVLGPGVIVEPGAIVRDSVLMDDCLVRREARVERCIFDKRVRVGASAIVGRAEDGRPNEEQPDVLAHGITLVGQNARIPAHQRIGTNCLVGMMVGPEDFHTRTLPDGSALRSVHSEHPVRLKKRGAPRGAPLGDPSIAPHLARLAKLSRPSRAARLAGARRP
jgi:glucose-1-phosphate adenylyltransferase